MDKKKILLSVLGILFLVVTTLGISYAVFTYVKIGTTENTVTTGTLKFLYTENTGVGRGINISEALPVSDQIGKSYSTENYVFDFRIEGANTGNGEIPYEVTLRKNKESTLSDSNIKIYLTDMTEDLDTLLIGPTLYSNLTQTNIDVGDEVEKTLYSSTIVGNTNNYLKEFRLRMWIDQDSKQSDINGKTFATTVNVYSNVPLISEEEQASRNSTEISELNLLNVNSTGAAKVENQPYDYNVGVAPGSTSITINPEVENSDAIVTVRKVASLSYEDSNIQRLASSNTFDLTTGDNYFIISVTNANRSKTTEYKLRVYVAEVFTIFGKKFPIVENTPTLTNSSNNTGDASGLYKSTATNNSSPTYYFRGNVENNYVKFANGNWRIVRINEDGTIRIVRETGSVQRYSTSTGGIKFSYYTNAADIKGYLTNMYSYEINSAGFSDKVATGNYFCEEYRVHSSNYSSYTPTFKCQTDENGYGIISGSFGLLTYDEAVFAGGYYNKANSDYYLNNGTDFWLMSPNSSSQYSFVWKVASDGGITSNMVAEQKYARPVLNLKSTVTATGTGTKTDPFVIQ